MSSLPILLFDRDAEVTIVERRLPHWSQAGVICFVTLRTHDSMPADVLDRWRSERMQWLRQHGINPRSADWQERLQLLPEVEQQDFHRHFSRRWHDELDHGHGSCVLRDRQLATIVAESLLHFDGERYLLTDFVVMPNHVHLLASFADEQSMLTQCESWKHYTAVQINGRLGRKGRFWQQDGFDHLLRSEDQFRFLQRYVGDNPKQAKLRTGEFIHYQNDQFAP